MPYVLCWILLLAQVTTFRLTPTKVAAGRDSYTICVPAFKGERIDVKYHLNDSPPEVAVELCALDSSGQAVIAVPEDNPRGLIRVVGVRRSGTQERVPVDARMEVVSPDDWWSTYRVGPADAVAAESIEALPPRQPLTAIPPAPPLPDVPDRPWSVAGVFRHNFRTLGAALLVLAAIFSAGTRLLALLGRPFDDRSEVVCFSWILGCLAISILSLAVALAGLVYPLVFLLIALAALTLGDWRKA